MRVASDIYVGHAFSHSDHRLIIRAGTSNFCSGVRFIVAVCWVAAGKFCWAAAIPVIANMITAVQRKDLRSIVSSKSITKTRKHYQIVGFLPCLKLALFRT